MEKYDWEKSKQLFGEAKTSLLFSSKFSSKYMFAVSHSAPLKFVIDSPVKLKN